MTRTRSLADRARDPSLSGDTTPELGGNLDVNGNHIVSTSNGNIAITPHGSGKVVLDGLSWPTSDGSSNQLLKTDGSGSLSFATVNSDVVSDTTPQLGGSLDVNGNAIVSASNGNISITPNGSGKVIIDGLSHPTSDGSSGQFLKTDGSGSLSFDTVNTDLSSDSTPQLGGNLDVNGNSIVSASNGNISITPNGSGKIILDGLSFPTADGSANTVLKTDGSGNLSFSSVSGLSGSGIQQVQDDTSPVLGGNLNANSKTISSVGSIAIDNITIDGSTITSDTHLNLDIVGDFLIDVDGQEVKLSDGGTQFGALYQSSNNFYLQSSVSNKDMKFEVNDAGSITTALTLSGANAGAATFNSTVQATRYYVDGTSKLIDSPSGDYGSIRVEGGTWAGYAIRDDWVFMSNGTSEAGIYNDTRNEWSVLCYDNGRVVLCENGTESFRTKSQGARVKSTSNSADGTLFLGDNEHSYIFNDEGSHTKITTGSAENFIYANENSYTYLYNNGSWRLRVNSNGISVINSNNNDGTVYLGDSGDSYIVNDAGTATYITNDLDELFIYSAENSHTYLYWNGTWTIRTNNAGINVRHYSTTVDGTISLGSSEHAKIVNDAGSYLALRTDGDEYGLYCSENAYTYLYYNGSWKVRTYDNGIDVNGSVDLSGLLYINGSRGSSGDVLTSNGGSSPTWQAPGGGTWTEVNTVALTANGSSGWQNWSITADKQYRFTFYDFYFQGYNDKIGARMSSDGGSSFKNCYGTGAFRNSWSLTSWNNTSVSNSSWLRLTGAGVVKGSDTRYRGLFCQCYVYAPTNGGGGIFAETWWRRDSYETSYSQARYATVGFSHTVNYIRFQPYDYGSQSNQGFRGYLKVETLG